MANDLTEISHGVVATMFLATEIAWRFADVLVTKGILTKDEAYSTLYALADGIRRDAHGTNAEATTERLARTLESNADEVWPRKR